jgi:hypothetical protein
MSHLCSAKDGLRSRPGICVFSHWLSLSSVTYFGPINTFGPGLAAAQGPTERERYAPEQHHMPNVHLQTSLSGRLSSLCCTNCSSLSPTSCPPSLAGAFHLFPLPFVPPPSGAYSGQSVASIMTFNRRLMLAPSQLRQEYAQE